MNTLIRHIEYLIAHHDCVIIPGFGAILATYVSAEYDSEAQLFMPPYRKMAFNSTLRHNDGMLAASIQMSEGVSYESALTKMRKGVDCLLSCLQERGEVSLGAIGTIVSEDSGAAMYLRCDSAQCLGIGSFWLPTISAKESVKHEAVILDAPVKKGPRMRFGRIIRGAASIAVLLGIGFVASTPLTVDDAMLASLAPEISHLSAYDILPQQEAPAVLTIIAPRADAVGPDFTDHKAGAQADATPTADSSAYYVIVATLASKAEADKYIALRPDQGLKILEKGAHFKIYVSEHSDVYEAYRSSAAAAKKYPGAWVYKK